MRTRLWRTVRLLLRRSQIERDLDDELRAYVDEMTRRQERAGVEKVEARRRALADMGSFGGVKDHVRAVLPGMQIDEMLTNVTQDFRFAARMLWRNRGFAASAMLILALGIAASTGLFAVIDAVVLHPLPYAGADRIARVRLVPPSGRPRPADVNADEFRALRTASTLDGAYIHGGFTKTLGGTSFPESVWIEDFS